MQIEHVVVRNFRALKETSLSARFLTPIVGPNGAGKSSLLHALDLFFGPVGKLPMTTTITATPIRPSRSRFRSRTCRTRSRLPPPAIWRKTDCVL
jgi:predicted ATP-dependent endonuclease of OLD family